MFTFYQCIANAAKWDGVQVAVIKIILLAVDEWKEASAIKNRSSPTRLREPLWIFAATRLTRRT
jgi:hypothetical protein